ncbi:very short patch repair endonuclease [Marinirhabdus gelatinilytica]|uniref:T/G mismatch-specific endonuclease n=1 Tax=Marinirhabdus gelatinilytica TaxID=1703343 RepID=A0A370QIN5_9FLAO|nr:very short patch repair endonuclease [Marinirhabdus gelatinilytica]RDK88205.1 T/G mismatch-specific endonuclease [Marinirhabdus gelatinilytica]
MVKYDKAGKIIVPRFNEENGFYTTKKRSRIMSRIRGKNTKPELTFRKALWARNIRYRVNNKQLPGTPDISIKKFRLAVFIDGEFWHGYNWDQRRETLKTNREFWIAKIERNMQKDTEVNIALRELGYTVFRFWESEVKKDVERCVNDVVGYIRSFPYFNERGLP